MEIPMEASDSSWRQRCYQRLRQLMDRQFNSSVDPRRFGDKKEDVLDYELYQAVCDENRDVDNIIDVLESVCTRYQLDLATIVNHVTPTGDSLLHVAAEFGKEEVAGLIAHHFPMLLNKRNKKGDTPLHVAARAKKIGAMNVILVKCNEAITSHLIDLNDKWEFMMSRNNYGNTALHEAVLSKHLDGFTFLLNEHRERDRANYWTWNKDHGFKSPMYLAIQTRNVEILDRLLQIPFISLDAISNEDTPLHAVISEQNPDLLRKIVNEKEELMYQRDENKNTPLHYLAYAGYVKGVHIMLERSAVIAFQRNSDGNLPIHLACKMGHVQVVEKLLELEWSNAGLWLNNEGQNILHIAAMSGKNLMVKYLLENPKIHDGTVNERDQHGDTPLHMASRNLFIRTLQLLSRDKRINVNLMNNEGLTARDIVQMQCQIPMTYQVYHADMILESAGVPLKTFKKMGVQRAATINREGNMKEAANTLREGNTKEAANTLILVAILIATVTFTAGFTVPGGFNPSDDANPKERGRAVLTNDNTFKIFIVCNTIAMYSSLFSAVTLLLIPLSNGILTIQIYRLGLLGVVAAIEFMAFAFLLATMLIVSNNPLLAVVVSFFAIISIIFILSTLFYLIVLVARKISYFSLTSIISPLVYTKNDN